jgi:hypothetical protein
MPSELNSAISKKEKKEKKEAKREAKGKLPKNESFQSVIDLGGLAPPSPAKKNLASVAESSSSAEDEKAFLAEHEITIHDPSAPPPCMSFDSAPFPAQLVKILNAQPFTTPSPVQAATWPLATMGRDCLSIAKTGSGKTLGFMLPAIAKCLASTGNRTVGPTVLIMAPTRELALQIKDEADKFGRPVGIQSVAVYGGAPKWKQTQELQRGADIVVATPGRMMDMLDLHGTAGGWPSTSLERCTVVILDEADRMLDMGFEKDIRSIWTMLPTVHLGPPPPPPPLPLPWTASTAAAAAGPPPSSPRVAPASPPPPHPPALHANRRSSSRPRGPKRSSASQPTSSPTPRS